MRVTASSLRLESARRDSPLASVRLTVKAISPLKRAQRPSADFLKSTRMATKLLTAEGLPAGRVTWRRTRHAVKYVDGTMGSPHRLPVEFNQSVRSRLDEINGRTGPPVAAGNDERG